MSQGEAFYCQTCGEDFVVPKSALAKYPGWKPRTCLRCRNAKGPKGSKAAPQRDRRARVPEANLTIHEVLQRHHGGPSTGLFTDGSANPNPGPGGWGVVYVVDNEVIDHIYGHEPHTTNNRMELRALIEAFKMGPPDVDLDVWTDSDLCVKTITRWAPSWEKRGWRRKDGPVKNVELVKELYSLAQSRPNLRLRWIKAHDGSRWNEYADSLATAYSRKKL